MVNVEQFVLVPVLGQNMSRSCVPLRKDHACEPCCDSGRRNAKVNHVSHEEREKMAFATVDANELAQPRSPEISALFVTF